MKARKKGSNYEWENVAYVQLENSDILFKEQYLEFQHDESPTELKTNDQDEEKHWQDVRERAAIAAMQSFLTNPYTDMRINSADVIAKYAIKYGDALVKLLKGE
jgi:hypothetical protein